MNDLSKASLNPLHKHFVWQQPYSLTYEQHRWLLYECTHLNMCLLSMFGTFRDCCSSREVVTGLQSLALSLAHATALALRSKGCSDVLLDGGSAITMGGVVLGSCFTEGTASSLIPSASDTVGEGTVRPERWE